MNDNIISRYWRIYGGFSALLKSPYMWFAFCLNCVLYPLWSEPNWWDLVISVVPNLLGFSLGGYAMWIAIGDDDFRKLISGETGDGNPSPYMEVNATFVHFILLQMTSLLLAILSKALYFKLPNDHLIYLLFGNFFSPMALLAYFFSHFLFIYALSSAIAATFALFRVSSWYDINRTVALEEEKKKNTKKP